MLPERKIRTMNRRIISIMLLSAIALPTFTAGEETAVLAINAMSTGTLASFDLAPFAPKSGVTLGGFATQIGAQAATVKQRQAEGRADAPLLAARLQ